MAKMALAYVTPLLSPPPPYIQQPLADFHPSIHPSIQGRDSRHWRPRTDILRYARPRWTLQGTQVTHNNNQPLTHRHFFYFFFSLFHFFHFFSFFFFSLRVVIHTSTKVQGAYIRLLTRIRHDSATIQTSRNDLLWNVKPDWLSMPSFSQSWNITRNQTSQFGRLLQRTKRSRRQR